MAQLRTTRQKQLILEILCSEGAPLTATHLYQRAVAIHPTMAKSTVYRNLEAMVKRGEVEKGFLENGESFFSIAGQSHRHYMICRECNRMQDLADCPIAHLAQHIKDDSGFVPIGHTLQIYGYCRECAQKHKK